MSSAPAHVAGAHGRVATEECVARAYTAGSDDGVVRRARPPWGRAGSLACERPGTVVRTLVLIHTVPPLVESFTTWCGEILPDVRLLHVLDEPLLERIRRRGDRAPEDDERLAGHLALAEGLGVDAVLVTCSTVSLGAAAVRSRFTVPIVLIDDALAREAIGRGDRITLIATNTTTIEPSTAALLNAARAAGRTVVVRPRLVDGALAALLAGDGVSHDRLVEAAIREATMADSDVVVLAQATMTRVLSAMADRPAAVPVLASPPLALREVRRILGAGDSASKRSLQSD